MNTKDIIYQLRTKKGLSQDALAHQVFVTRQAVSRWEKGETVPNTETLKLLSKLFDVSINTLLGSPHRLVCQCCGMPLEDDLLGRDKDGSLNENYCKWCYVDGSYVYNDMDTLVDVCVVHMVNESFTEQQARAYMKEKLPMLDYWKHKDKLNDGSFEALKKQLIREINNLSIQDMPKLEKLNALSGDSINLAYPLPSGQSVTFLEENTMYLGNQLAANGDRYFGVLANVDFILISMYDKDGNNPELILYKKRIR